MDQRKTNLPHIKAWNMLKGWKQDGYLHTHLTGVIIHGKQNLFILDYAQWKQDSNLTINILLAILVNHFGEKPLTPTMYLQMDNCWRENKNHYVFGFLAYLVALGYFEQIQVTFLPVGHTHEDIDAKFGNFSASLRILNALTMKELISVIKDVLKEAKLEPYILSKLYNVKDWLVPFLNDIHYLSDSHCFLFVKDTPNHVTMKYKKYAQSPVWYPLASGDKIELFQVDRLGRQTFPTGVPELLEHNFLRKDDFGQISKNIE